ncbi:hypothetical protein NUW58_g1490 [Xylaria curta]|uniref:Uncharacterized protein n=1 Tax=Xylaria curta TaxID=42375 RepID=A0ACC1PJX2_9PEZI|nr:hypothetical protein NUW58_g1490 [Xylaria curta]
MSYPRANGCNTICATVSQGKNASAVQKKVSRVLMTGQPKKKGRAEMDPNPPRDYLLRCQLQSESILLLLSYGRMLSHVESVANDIYGKIGARDYVTFGNLQLPKIVLEIEDCSSEIAIRLQRLTWKIPRINDVPVRVELSSVIQARIEAHPSRQRFEQSLDQLHRITAAAIGTESRRPYDAEHSLEDIEREVENIINVPILYSKKESNGQFANTFIRSLESLEERFSPILGGSLTLPVPFVHDFWYQHIGERDAFFNNELKEPIPPMLRHDSLRRTPLHFIVEKMLFEPGPYSMRFPLADRTEVQLFLQNYHLSRQIDAQDAFGRTALHIACDHGNEEEGAMQSDSFQSDITHILLDHGAKIDIIDECGRLAIDSAIAYNNYPVLEVFMIKRGLNLEGIYSAMAQIESAMNSALDASRIACERAENEIEMDTMDE